MIDKDNRRRAQQNKFQSISAKAYIQKIRQFLTTFKTSPCNLDYQHDLQACLFHHGSDARRNPYLEHTFAYYPTHELIPSSQQSANLQDSLLCLNKTQILYHPLIYKVQRCISFCNCPLQMVCSFLHSDDQKCFQYGEFFRFDINAHKTKPCPRRDFHERKTCIYYHNESDRRRANFQSYSHQLCSRQKCNYENCHFSHNKIQQVYHPSRYKSKFCKTYTNKNIRCQYKQFCAFAHTQAQIKIQMIHLLNRDYDFYLQKFKTVWCPDTLTHDRSTCVYAHNIQDFRRNPFKYNYQAEKCSFWNFEEELKSIQDSGCRAGMNCDKCHGWMEQRYHPQIFKKNKCEYKDKEANSIIQKKIVNTQKEVKQPKEKVSRISIVVQEKVSQINKNAASINGIRDVGAPFFKKQNASQSSRKTKALTTNLESDDSAKDELNVNPQHLENYQPVTRKKSLFFLSEDDIWKKNPNQDNYWAEPKVEEERARSENKFDDCQTIYSHSLKETVGDNSILRKLKENNINQLRLKNLCETEIKQLNFLQKQEKQKLTNSIKLYQLRRQRNPVIYTIQLAKFFIKKNREDILEKMKVKRIKQQRLLKMKPKQIEKLDFLNQKQRKELPLLLGEYKSFRDEKQYSQIVQEISRFVSPKRNLRQT